MNTQLEPQRDSKRPRNKWFLRPVSSSSRSQLLRFPSKRSTRLSGFRLFRKITNYTTTYTRNSFHRYCHYPRQKNASDRFLAFISTSRFKMRELNTRLTHVVIFSLDPEGQELTRSRGLTR